ncbi:hypothetical protein L873DRAFT_1796429 [Choiromyces venosus 120613-1]|uniref:Uncharacterized protein n=1 Tax=Choiromyces venosus 120613-1 TaxID=1336337 RepID=A0A3N4ISZ6_9PEZI|nr:hypothetical protein L873DRAFT_1796429 [Choiromyces venosus 120613-1]
MAGIDAILMGLCPNGSASVITDDPDRTHRVALPEPQPRPPRTSPTPTLLLRPPSPATGPGTERLALVADSETTGAQATPHPEPRETDHPLPHPARGGQTVTATGPSATGPRETSPPPSTTKEGSCRDSLIADSPFPLSFLAQVKLPSGATSPGRLPPPNPDPVDPTNRASPVEVAVLATTTLLEVSVSPPSRNSEPSSWTSVSTTGRNHLNPTPVNIHFGFALHFKPDSSTNGGFSNLKTPPTYAIKKFLVLSSPAPHT